MFSNGGQTLLEQKRLQWAREREEMVGLCGLWGTLDKPSREKPVSTELRRNSLLPPIQAKSEDVRAEESETSGYISDSPQHDYESSSSSQKWSAERRENYWAERKAQKNLRNESRVRGTPDSLLSTPEDRLKWGDRGVGVGHLWEPVVEVPESRLPQVFESFRATPKWVERGLKLADGNQADILFIHHDDDEQPQTKFLLGQNVPLPPEILEERERKRQKAMEHQNAIRKQLEDREKKRKEEKEMRLREERMEEERIVREQELERKRLEEELKKTKERENLEKRKEKVMKEAIEAAEQKAKEEKKKQKRQEDFQKVNEVFEPKLKPKEPQKIFSMTETPRENIKQPKSLKDSFCQSEIEPPFSRQTADSSSQSESISGLGFMNVGSENGLALVLDGVSDAVQLALLMPQSNTSDHSVLAPSQLRSVRILTDATTQTNSKCCSVSLNSTRSRRSLKQSSRASGRSDSSEKSTSLERQHNHHARCMLSTKQRSRSQPRLSVGDRPKWGINRPSVQYMKQSEKDPHYMRRLKRRGKRTKEVGTCTMREKLLESEYRLLAFQTDDENEKKEVETGGSNEFGEEEKFRDILEHGFRMVSNPSSPRFVPIGRTSEVKESEELFEFIVMEEKGGGIEVQNGYEVIEKAERSNFQTDSSGSGYETQSFCESILVLSTKGDPVAEVSGDKGGKCKSDENTEVIKNIPRNELRKECLNNQVCGSSESDSTEDSSKLETGTGSTDCLSPADGIKDTSELFSSDEFEDSGFLSSLLIEDESHSSGVSKANEEIDPSRNPEQVHKTEFLDLSEDDRPATLEESCTSPFSDTSGKDGVPTTVGITKNEESIPAEDTCSPPSSSRSDPKSNDEDADNDDDSDDEDNRSVVSGTLLPIKSQKEAIDRITALKMGLQLLQKATESRCSTPASFILSLSEDNE